MERDKEQGFDSTNVQSELLLCGIMYKSPETYIKYGSSIRSKYDFSDPATRFFYDQFEDYYLTFSQDISENKDVSNEASDQKTEDVEIKKGERIGQAIFQKYLVTDNDIAQGERTGGFGSTNN